MASSVDKRGAPPLSGLSAAGCAGGRQPAATDTGRRMAFFGPFSIDPIFDDLEAELGEAIPETVIEAQRRNIKEAWSTEMWKRGTADFQKMIALRGLGDLTLFGGDRDHLRLGIENSCLHLHMVGTIQALVELAYRKERSTAQWTLGEDGDLDITISIED